MVQRNSRLRKSQLKQQDLTPEKDRLQEKNSKKAFIHEQTPETTSELYSQKSPDHYMNKLGGGGY